MILMYALKTPLSAQCAGVLSTEHSVQSNPSALSALSTEMHHQNKTLSTKCCHPHGHSVLSTSTVCAPDTHTGLLAVVAAVRRRVVVVLVAQGGHGAPREMDPTVVPSDEER